MLTLEIREKKWLKIKGKRECWREFQYRWYQRQLSCALVNKRLTCLINATQWGRSIVLLLPRDMSETSYEASISLPVQCNMNYVVVYSLWSQILPCTTRRNSSTTSGMHTLVWTTHFSWKKNLNHHFLKVNLTFGKNNLLHSTNSVFTWYMLHCICHNTLGLM